MINRTIAHYKITSKLGQGGMGEVYRATDTQLGREVAIKILPASFAEDSNRVARFNREARALAALNHANIAIIYGIEQHGDSQALVMELIEGETLGQRLKRQPMTVTEALECCKQIAEALEAAHEKGIIHRDLKPDNVKISEEGHVKVLDFGLAKEVVDPSAADSQGESPTITHMTTIPGELLGTAPYMSPEQARARPVDKRSDIWAFGCVLYECLTGQPMFKGEDVTETLASIIKGEPDWAALPEDTPPTIELLLRKCLNKDRKRRLRDIGDARIDLEQAMGDPTSSIIRLSDQALRESVERRGIHPLLAAGVAVLLIGLTAVVTWSLKPNPTVPIRRFSVDFGVKANLFLRHGHAVRISPDGTMLGYILIPEEGADQRQLFVRRLDQLEATPIPAADGLSEFCFSPDGQWIAFGRIGSLFKVSINGGAAVTLSEERGIRGVHWADDGWIFFGGIREGVSRIAATGGPSERLTTLSDNEEWHRWPQSLPGGRAFLFTSGFEGSGKDEANIMVQRLAGGEPETLLRGGYNARYLPSGHLVYIQQATLFAIAFDADSLSLKGQPSPLLEEVTVNESGTAHFDVSAAGDLVYVKGTLFVRRFAMEWIDKRGNRQPLLPAGRYGSFKLSPDGRFLAYSLDEGEQEDIWIYDIARGVPSKLTFDPADDDYPIWSPSGQSLVFRSEREGTRNLYWKRADGSGEAQRLTDSPDTQIPWSWHADGKHLAIGEYPSGEQGYDLRIVHLTGDDRTGWTAVETTDFLTTRFHEYSGRFSPDGRWLAYASYETGQPQVYVRSFPEGGGKKQISIEGLGSFRPIWSEKSQSLSFATSGLAGIGEYQIFTANYRVDEQSFMADRPVRREGATASGSSGSVYDLHPDGERLLASRIVDANDSKQVLDRVVLFENFLDYLCEQVPVD